MVYVLFVASMALAIFVLIIEHSRRSAFLLKMGVISRADIASIDFKCKEHRKSH